MMEQMKADFVFTGEVLGERTDVPNDSVFEIN